MILSQIISDIATANWVIAIAIIIVGFLLTRILNKIEKKLEEHDSRIQQNELEIEVIKRIDGRN